MTGLPRGTVTFLFTDIEGSTRIWDAFPEDARRVLAIHDDIVTAAIAAQGGHVVKHTGDGIFAAFDSAVAATGTAIEAQTAIAETDWPPAVESLGVRMALHTATIEPRDGDYHGPDVNRAARLEAAGHGGQILVSATTHALIAHAMPQGTVLTDLGSHLLRGLAEPEQIHQLTVTGLRSVFPQLRTAATIDARLPSFSTTFLGRGAEIQDLADRLDDPSCRLLALLGPGGIGKTRLAVEAAEAASRRTGVVSHFYGLTGTTDASDVIRGLGESIGFTFDIHISAQIPEKAQLFDRLRAQPLILVLDNVEHLLPEVATTIDEMLASIPTLTVLATSRKDLGISAAWRYDVRGLDDSREDEATALFADRAHRAGATIDEAGADGPAVRALTALLGGVPLAIELAASWTTVLSPSEIAEEVERNLEFLETPTQDTLDRHRSMRAVFDHSWDLLPEDLRRAYARLSIFAAPFDRAAAESVARVTVKDLARLAGHSLVFRSGIDRYALHPLLREFAAAKSAEEVHAARDRYTRHYWRFLIDRASALEGGAEQMAVRDEVAEELDHIRAASDDWVRHFDDEEATAAVRALAEFYFLHSWVDHRSHSRRLRSTFEATFDPSELPGREAYLWTMVLFAITETSFATPDDVRSILEAIEHPWRARGGNGWATWLLAKGIELALRGHHEESLEPFRAAGREAAGAPPVFEGQLAAWYGWALLEAGRLEEAAAVFDRGLQKVDADQHYLGRAFLLSKSGLAAEAAGDHQRAIQLQHEGREIFVKSGDLGGQGYTLSRLSWSHYRTGEYELARRYALEGLAKFEEMNHRWGIAVSYGRLGQAEVALGRLGDAAGHFLTCFDRATEAGLVEQQHYAITGIGLALAKAARFEAAAALLAPEAVEERNPYRDFAADALARLPEELREPADDEMPALDDLADIARTHAAELAREP